MNLATAKAVATKSLAVPNYAPSNVYLTLVRQLNQEDSRFQFGSDGRITCLVCNVVSPAGTDDVDDEALGVDVFGSFENYKAHINTESHKARRNSMSTPISTPTTLHASSSGIRNHVTHSPQSIISENWKDSVLGKRQVQNDSYSRLFIDIAESSDEDIAADTPTKRARLERSEPRRRSPSVIFMGSTTPLVSAPPSGKARAHSVHSVSSGGSHYDPSFPNMFPMMTAVPKPTIVDLETPGAGPSRMPGGFPSSDEGEDEAMYDDLRPLDESDDDLHRFPSRDMSVNFHIEGSQSQFRTPSRPPQVKDRVPSARQMQQFGSYKGSNGKDFSLNYDVESPTRKEDRVGPGLKTDYKKFTDSENLRNLLNDKVPTPKDARAHLASLDLLEKLHTSLAEGVTLLEHQMVGLSWMLKQELEGGEDSWALADEMGLGKTLQTIALIVCNPAPLIKHEIDYDMPIEGQWEGPPTRNPTLIIVPASLVAQWEAEFSKFLRPSMLRVGVHHLGRRVDTLEKVEDLDVIITTYGTIRSEFKFKLQKRKKKKRPTKKINGLPTSQPPLEIPGEEEEEDYIEVPEQRKVLASYRWHRVIIDEAQNIRNRNVKLSQCVAKLDAKYRGVLTGTPVTNTLADLYGLLRFLHRKPFNDWALFDREVARLQRSDMRGAGIKAHTILKGVMLRRKKDDDINGKPLLELPAKVVEDPIQLEFGTRERELYKRVESEFQSKIKKVLEAPGRLDVKKMNVILVMILRLRQLCNHAALVKMKSIDALVNKVTDDPALRADDLARAQREMGQDWVTMMREIINPPHSQVIEVVLDPNPGGQVNICDACKDSLYHGARVTACEHQICEDCFEVAVKEECLSSGEIACPVCHDEVLMFLRSAFDYAYNVDNEGVFDQPIELDLDPPTPSPTKALQGGGDNGSSSSSPIKTRDQLIKTEPSAKIKELLRVVAEWMAVYDTEKIIVYSQWTSFIDIMQDVFKDYGIKSLRYDGKMSVDKRAQTLKQFDADSGPRVIFISLKCGGVGLNLVRANKVINMDLAWNWATEAQAIDRVHRLGQKRAVTVKRLVIKDTIEERIIRLQGRKQELADAAVGDGEHVRNRLTVADVARLFNIDPDTLEHQDEAATEECHSPPPPQQFLPNKVQKSAKTRRDDKRFSQSGIKERKRKRKEREREREREREQEQEQESSPPIVVDSD